MNPVGKRILLVEDDEQIRETLQLALEIEGFVVAKASDGLDALAILNAGALPDLILLDMLMPKMNGWECAAAIKADPRAPMAAVPIVAVTATSEKIQQQPGHFEHVIKKPIELEELYRVVNRFCRKRSAD